MSLWYSISHLFASVEINHFLFLSSNSKTGSLEAGLIGHNGMHNVEKNDFGGQMFKIIYTISFCFKFVLYGNAMTFFDTGVDICFVDKSGECIHLMPK